MNKTNKKHGFAGFLEGYKASNIASSETAIEYYLNEMQEKIQSILSQREVLKCPFGELEKLSDIINEPNTNYISKYTKIGESLKTIVLEEKNSPCANNFLTNEKMKKIVYNFLELAEKSEDKQVSSIAIEIAESL